MSKRPHSSLSLPSAGRFGAPLLFLSLLFLSGCTTLAVDRAEVWPDPPAVELTDVPFFPQTEFHCGPAALATLLNESGLQITPEALAPGLYLPDRQGSLQIEVAGAARRQGRLAYRIGPAMDELLAQVAAGHPVLVLQNLALSWYPKWHYAVVVGYDRHQYDIILRSGTIERHVTRASKFERTWQRAGGWGLVVLKPGELPARPILSRYLQASGGLEQANELDGALLSYQTAAQQWPESELPLMGIGNVTYRQGRREASAEAFRTATQLNPASADAFNNLAHVLGELGRRDEALVAARQAVALGGDQRPEYRQTLEEIQNRQ